MSKQHVIAITGGIGGAKLGLGLSRVLQKNELVFVANTGDDFEHLGLHISPDIDTLMYTLAGESNTETGWGRSDETWQFMSSLADLGGETWFRLGDKDLALHVERTQRLAAGHDLATVTHELAVSLGVDHRILPMSNDPVRTVIQTRDGDLDFQHYFVRDQCEPEVSGFSFRGSKDARLTPDIEELLCSSDLAGVILCPSNPFVSIDPILSVPGLRSKLRECVAPVIAVSPVVDGTAIKGPTVKMMQELGVPNTAVAVASHYHDFLNGFVLDSKDAGSEANIEALGMACLVTQTVMTSVDDRVQLARDCLEFVSRLSQSPQTMS